MCVYIGSRASVSRRTSLLFWWRFAKVVESTVQNRNTTDFGEFLLVLDQPLSARFVPIATAGPNE